jgi:hypothetical protein
VINVAALGGDGRLGPDQIADVERNGGAAE